MSPRQARKAARAAHRKAIAAQNQLLYQQAVQALKNQSFVVEIDQIVFPRGNTVFVSSLTNFVYVNDGKAVIQIATNNFAPGPNGVGGITVEGTPSNISMSTNNKGFVFFNFMDQGIAVSATVNIQLTEGSNRATINILPNFNNNNLMLTGTIVPYEDSTIFQGQTI